MNRMLAEVEALKLHCKRVEMDVAHLRNVIARMRSHDSDEFARETDLIKKLRERVDEIELRMASIEKRLPPPAP